MDLVGIGIAILFGFLVYAVKDLPPFLAWSGVAFGAVLAGWKHIPVDPKYNGPMIAACAAVIIAVGALAWALSVGRDVANATPQKGLVSSQGRAPVPKTSEAQLTAVQHEPSIIPEPRPKPDTNAQTHTPRVPQESVTASNTPGPALHAQPESIQAAPTTLTREQKVILVKEFADLRAELPALTINRGGSPENPLMGDFMEVIQRSGIALTTGFQEPAGPDQTDVMIAVPDPQAPPVLALKVKKILALVGIRAPLIKLPQQATQAAFVIFLGPPPL